MTASKITAAQWMKVLRVLIYVAISFVIAVIPAVLAHNIIYLSLAAPINVALVTLQQLFTPSPTVQADTQAVMQGMSDITNQVTDSQGKPVTDPNAPH